MRDLTPTETKNEFNSYNKASDTLEKLYYKTITTSDIIHFKSRLSLLYSIKDDKERVRSLFTIQIDTALNQITGFAEDTYSYNGKVLSSDPESKNYDPGWKEKLKEIAGDTLILFCGEMFGEPNIFLKKNSLLEMSLRNTTTAGPKKNGSASLKIIQDQKQKKSRK